MKKQIQIWLRVVPVAVLGVALLVTGCRAPAPVSEPVAEVAAAPAPLVAAPSPVAASTQGGLPQEGIKVHGHWTIEVRNQDGSLAEVREFENALNSLGSLALSKFLARMNSVGGWEIILLGDNSTSGAFHSGPSYDAHIRETSEPTPLNPQDFNTLTVGVPGSGTNQGKLVLSGTAVALNDGNIGMVTTLVSTLPPTEAPSSTYGIMPFFTFKTLGTPVSLLAGQQVQITVVISFS